MSSPPIGPAAAMSHVTVTAARAYGSRKAYRRRADAARSARAHRTSWTVAAVTAAIATAPFQAPGQGCLKVMKATITSRAARTAKFATRSTVFIIAPGRP